MKTALLITAMFGSFAIGLIYHFLLGVPSRGIGEDCYVEWDGRSNPDVCD
jgi:hypothetical protein